MTIDVNEAIVVVVIVVVVSFADPLPTRQNSSELFNPTQFFVLGCHRRKTDFAPIFFRRFISVTNEAHDRRRRRRR